MARAPLRRSRPTNAQFDRELRLVVIENVANEAMTPAKALVRERLAKRFSVDGINSVISAYDRS